ncbi:hypothetical protein C8R43DRAFT_942702 [Mycena crocata]|nr:hypothetical protein C8R43DRAFT_942702 [Mycena crocata]
MYEEVKKPLWVDVMKNRKTSIRFFTNIRGEIANPDIFLTLLSQALEQGGAASQQARVHAEERDQEIAALRRDLTDMTHQRDTLRAQVAKAGKIEDVRKRLKNGVADALAPERTRYDERTKVLQAAKRELNDADGGSRCNVCQQRYDSEFSLPSSSVQLIALNVVGVTADRRSTVDDSWAHYCGTGGSTSLKDIRESLGDTTMQITVDRPATIDIATAAIALRSGVPIPPDASPVRLFSPWGHLLWIAGYRPPLNYVERTRYHERAKVLRAAEWELDAETEEAED